MDSFEDNLTRSFIDAQDQTGDCFGENFNDGVVSMPVAQAALQQGGNTVKEFIDPSRTYKDIENDRRFNDLKDQFDKHVDKQKQESFHEQIADTVGIGVGTLVGAAGVGTLDPLLIYGAPIAGAAAKATTKAALDAPPRTSEREISGMNGQDFEGINNF